MRYIDTIEVEGTVYEIVGQEGEYPMSVIRADGSVGEGYSTSEVYPRFYWRRTGESGSYEYRLVAGVQDPVGFEYADGCGGN